jgi:hypothetical protein
LRTWLRPKKTWLPCSVQSVFEPEWPLWVFSSVGVSYWFIDLLCLTGTKLLQLGEPVIKLGYPTKLTTTG